MSTASVLRRATPLTMLAAILGTVVAFVFAGSTAATVSKSRGRTARFWSMAGR